MFGLDPLRVLAADPDDAAIIHAGLTLAVERRAQEMRALADYHSGRTAGLTARSITRWIARSFRKRG